MARFTLMTVLSSGCVGLNFEAGVCGYSRNVSSGPGAGLPKSRLTFNLVLDPSL